MTRPARGPDMERAGIDIVTDGEIRRESYSNQLRDRAGRRRPRRARRGPRAQRAPGPWSPRRRRRSAGRGRWRRATSRSCAPITDRKIKITVPGPFTMSQQAQNDYYGDERRLALAYAEAVNEELHDLVAAGRRHRSARRAVPAGAARSRRGNTPSRRSIGRLRGSRATTVLHICFGYARGRAREAQRLRVPRRARRMPRRRSCRSRRHSRASTWPSCGRCRARGSWSESSTSAIADVETAEVIADADPQRARARAARATGPGAGLRDEVPAARAGVRQARAMVAGARLVRRELDI